MKVYNFKYHIVLSTIISFIIGGISFFIAKPHNLNTSKGLIKLIDDPTFSHTQITYGYDLIFAIIFISLFLLLVLYKPVKKIIQKQLT